MKVIKLALFILLLISYSCSDRKNNSQLDEAISSESRTDLLFDDNWLFFRGDAPGAESAEFVDSSWRLLDLPHDWSIEDIPGTSSPFDSAAVGGLDAGYLVGGTGWYRKKFMVPDDLNDKRFQLQFDGIYMNSDIWLNGHHLGNHPYGYTSFRYDLTDFLLPGKENIIAVKVRNEGHNSRWYTGSGIYRHVYLTVTDPLHLDPWWLSITTQSADQNAAFININATVFNGSGETSELMLVTRILDKSGAELSSTELKQSSNKGDSSVFLQHLSIASPQLWSTETPSLYTAVNEIYMVTADGTRKLKDKISTQFGIRTIEINASEGFLLNGKHLLLKGGCMHHDNGPLGAAAFDRAEERRVMLMKESGFNAIRCSHNPPSPAFLDACDRLGMMIIDESFDMWTEQKNPDDYHLYFNEWWQRDVESMVRRDRNHASVILWSIGNEIPERSKTVGAELAKLQADFIRNIDSSRLITSAVNSLDPDKDAYFARLDVSGYNYAVDKYVSDHKRLPDRIILSTESFSLEAFEYWMAVEDYPWVIGDFVWTGFDYLGEASIGWFGYPHNKSFFPWNHAYCGDIDICGFKRPQSFYRDILWKNGKQISLFVKPPVPSFPVNPEKASWSKWEWQDVVASWNWEGYEGKKIGIEIYSSYPEVELFLNNVSLGRKKTNRSNEWIATWDVSYEPGVLRAKGYDEKGATETCDLITAEKPAQLRLKADRDTISSDGQDLSYITVELLDQNGIRNPTAEEPIEFTIEGPGTIQATGSSNPKSLESFQGKTRKTWQGRCIVILRSGKTPGDLILKASSEKAGSSEILIRSL
jgi:beta-galactosidase